jgi:hypothetical protein
MAKIQRPVEGCQAACCRYGVELRNIPPKPYGVTWAEYTPHLTGNQDQYLVMRWEKEYSRNTGRPPRRFPTGWPADLGASERVA